MIITFADFPIADGVTRLHQTLSEESLTLTQQTQVEPPLRGAWKVAFPSRAVRSMPLRYVVTYPPCETQADAVMQSRMILVQCPKGGVLIEYYAGTRITYASAWIEGSIQCQRIGVTNVFTFSLEATNPTAQSLVLDELGEILTDEEGNELEY